MSRDDIRKDLQSTVVELDYTIRSIKSQLPKNEYDPGPYLRQDPNGRYILLDALVVMAQSLVALEALTKETDGQEPLPGL